MKVEEPYFNADSEEEPNDISTQPRTLVKDINQRNSISESDCQQDMRALEDGNFRKFDLQQSVAKTETITSHRNVTTLETIDTLRYGFTSNYGFEDPAVISSGYQECPKSHCKKDQIGNSRGNQLKKSILSSSMKDFISENSHCIKTSKDIKAEKANLRRQRAKEIHEKKNANPYGYKFFGIKEGSQTSQIFQQVYRSQEWTKISVINRMFEKQPLRHSKLKSSITNQAFEEPIVEIFQGNQYFSRNKKEEAWYRTNQSSINMLRSFRSLDIQDKDNEYGITQETQGGVFLAQALNRNSTLDNHNYGKDIEIPGDYTEFKKKKPIIRNVNNKQVQSGRMRNYQSSIIKDM